jgi:hypothetical protein
MPSKDMVGGKTVPNLILIKSYQPPFDNVLDEPMLLVGEKSQMALGCKSTSSKRVG